jgi:hypothetical protein
MSPTEPPINSTPFSSIPKYYRGQSHSTSYDTLHHAVNNLHTTFIVDQCILHTPPLETTCNMHPAAKTRISSTYTSHVITSYLAIQVHISHHLCTTLLKAFGFRLYFLLPSLGYFVTGCKGLTAWYKCHVSRNYTHY